MSRDRPPAARSERAIEALLELRELKSREARARLQAKHAEMARLEGEAADLRRRRDNVIRRGGGRVLQERLLLDAILRLLVERQRRLERLRREAARLLEGYLAARSRRDSVKLLRDRRRLEADLLRERKADAVACDLAGSRKLREPAQPREVPWED